MTMTSEREREKDEIERREIKIIRRENIQICLFINIQSFQCFITENAFAIKFIDNKKKQEEEELRCFSEELYGQQRDRPSLNSFLEAGPFKPDLFPFFFSFYYYYYYYYEYFFLEKKENMKLSVHRGMLCVVPPVSCCVCWKKTKNWRRRE